MFFISIPFPLVWAFGLLLYTPCIPWGHYFWCFLFSLYTFVLSIKKKKKSFNLDLRYSYLYSEKISEYKAQLKKLNIKHLKSINTSNKKRALSLTYENIIFNCFHNVSILFQEPSWCCVIPDKRSDMCGALDTVCVGGRGFILLIFLILILWVKIRDTTSKTK